MDVGHLVRFASQQHPYLVEPQPCLDLSCDCTMMELTLREWNPSAVSPKEQLAFTLRVCLKTWAEHDPPPRSLEVETLAREFLARFPDQRIRELCDLFERERATQRRLQSLCLTGSPDELMSYPEVLREEGGMRHGVSDDCQFFVFEGREFLIEDHYCANPACDCQQVHLEFWERVHEFLPQHRIQIVQRLMVTVSLEGKLNEIRYREESSSTTKYLVLAWQRRGSLPLVEFRRRYEVMKTIGRRSFPQSTARPKSERIRVDGEHVPQRASSPEATPRVGRNDPCPCGSGLKFKRCCARRPAARS